MTQRYLYSKHGKLNQKERKQYPIKKIKGSRFDAYDLDIPDDCDMIVVGINKGRGIEPVTLLLRHQLSKERLDSLFSAGDVGEIVIMPTNSKHRLCVQRQADQE